MVYDRGVDIRIIPGDSIDTARIQNEQREVLAREKYSQNARYSSSTQIEVIGYSNLSCVPYLWTQGMTTRGYGVAKDYPVQSTPTQFASTFEGNAGHLVFVELDLGDKLQVRDANYKDHSITRRIIPKSLVKGYLL